MPLILTYLHAFQIAFGKACSICFPTLRQHMQQKQALPMVQLYLVQNFLLAYQKFSANSTYFVGTQAMKDGLGKGRGERRFHSSQYTHFQMNKCRGRICALSKSGCAHCL